MANNLQNALTITSAGVVMPDTSVIREAIINDLEKTVFQQKIDTSQETVLGRLIEWMTVCFAQVCGLTAWTTNQFNIKLATGVFLDAWASNFDMQRKMATSSRVLCTVTGTVGTVIPSGSLVSAPNSEYMFSCDSPITIDANGDGQGYFTATQTGNVPCDANTITAIRTAIAGWTTVNNGTAGIRGTDIESDYGLRSRILSANFTGEGYVGTVTKRLREIEDVGNVLVLSNPNTSDSPNNGVTMPGHSIYVCVQCPDTDEMKTKIADIIYKTKPIGAAYTYASESSGGINYDIRSYFRKITVTDQYSGQNIDVWFAIPALNALNMAISVTNVAYTGSDLEQEINDTISSFLTTKSIGSTVTSTEVAVAVQSSIGGIMVTSCSIGGIGSASCSNYQVFSKGTVTVAID